MVYVRRMFPRAIILFPLFTQVTRSVCDDWWGLRPDHVISIAFRSIGARIVRWCCCSKTRTGHRLCESSRRPGCGFRGGLSPDCHQGRSVNCQHLNTEHMAGWECNYPRGCEPYIPVCLAYFSLPVRYWFAGRLVCSHRCRLGFPFLSMGWIKLKWNGISECRQTCFHCTVSDFCPGCYSTSSL